MILPRSIERLITLPPAASKYAREAGNGFLPAWRVSSDRDGRKLGSGAGTIYALWSAWKENASGIEFEDWLNSSQKLIVHGGGESRRLPACSVLGKPLISLPPARSEERRA